MHALPIGAIGSSMPSSKEAIRFHVASNRGSPMCKSRLDATLTVTVAKNSLKQKGWRAVMNIDGVDKRSFGCWRQTIVEAVDQLLSTLSERVSQVEGARLRRMAGDMQTRRMSRQHATGTCGSQPTGSYGSQPSCNNPVAYIHQMYGLFRDGAEMSSLFQDSQRRWQQVAVKMGAMYHLWTADEVETLMKESYPQHWDMYCNVRYPIMRCDIGRLAIIHMYGGLYADLDTYPNRDSYEQVGFAVQRVSKLQDVPLSAKKSKKNKFAAKNTTSVAPSQEVIEYNDMEVLICSKANPIIFPWLDNIKAKIAEKPYANKKDDYHFKRMRYIWFTSGPKAMNKFFELPVNIKFATELKYITCNHFSVSPPSSMKHEHRQVFDVLSHESNSYFTKKLEIKKDVGSCDASLPMVPVAQRMRVKGCGVWRALSGSQEDREARAERKLPDKKLRVEMQEMREEWQGDLEAMGAINDFNNNVFDELYDKYQREMELKYELFARLSGIKQAVLLQLRGPMSDEFQDYIPVDWEIFRQKELATESFSESDTN